MLFVQDGKLESITNAPAAAETTILEKNSTRTARSTRHGMASWNQCRAAAARAPAVLRASRRSGALARHCLFEILNCDPMFLVRRGSGAEALRAGWE